MNEWLASAILRYIGISVPETALVELTPEFLSKEPELYISVGSVRERIPAGIHFGSRLAVDPNRTAIFDFLPDRLINRLENYADFLGIFVADKWMSNVDSRQAIFFRARGRALNHSSSNATGYFAQMIDHGFAFSGADWTFQDSPLRGLYFRRAVEGLPQSDRLFWYGPFPDRGDCILALNSKGCAMTGTRPPTARL